MSVLAKTNAVLIVEGVGEPHPNKPGVLIVGRSGFGQPEPTGR